MTVQERLNRRVKSAQEAHGVSNEDLARTLDLGVRTLNARFALQVSWTLDELIVLADRFFNGNFGGMLNPAGPVQNETRELIAEEVDRAVPLAIARHFAAIESRGASNVAQRSGRKRAG